jgi:hypothetical protein
MKDSRSRFWELSSRGGVQVPDARSLTESYVFKLVNDQRNASCLLLQAD